MRILFLSSWFPYPPVNGSKLRIYHLLRRLSDHHDVTLLSFSREASVPESSALQPLCEGIVVVPWKDFQADGWRARLGLFSPAPRSVVDTFSETMAQRIQGTLAERHYDLIIASEFIMGTYFPYFGNVPAVLEDIELGVLYEQYAAAPTQAQRLRYGLTWAKHRRYVHKLLSHFQAVTVVSEQEKALLQRQIDPGNGISVEVIPNCVDLAEYQQPRPQVRTNSLIFTGSFTYEPNYEAMKWFVGKVLPYVQSHVPETSLTITGNHAERPLPAATNVHRTGFVDDIRGLIGSSAASVVPIWTGGGTRLKILEAMALRAPVVSTSKGAEGLAVRDGKHLLIADDPEAFGEAVVRLLKEPALRAYLGSNGYDLVTEEYDWSSVFPRFLTMAEEVAAGR